MTTILPRFVAVCRGAAKNELANVLAKCGVSRPFVVTDPFLASSGKAQAVVEQMGVAAAAVSVRRVENSPSARPLFCSQHPVDW